MAEFRPRSNGNPQYELDIYEYRSEIKPTSNRVQDLRSYSASYATSSSFSDPSSMAAPTQIPKTLKKGKSSNGSISMAGWCFSDPELQRKKRVASYKAYTVEGKIKGTFRRSFKWIKDRYSSMVHGW